MAPGTSASSACQRREDVEGTTEPHALDCDAHAEPSVPVPAGRDLAPAARGASVPTVDVPASRLGEATPEVRAQGCPWRIDWHTLLQRVFDVDALACPCGGRLQFLEVVTSREQARTILLRLGLDADPPAVASRRRHDSEWDPDWDP
jgi:hypothetical protein